MKTPKTLILAAFLSFGLGTTSNALAEKMPSRAEMWKMLQQQGRTIEELKHHIEELKGMAGKGVQASATGTTTHAKQHSEAKQGTGPSVGAVPAWVDRINLGGVVEVEAGTTSNADGDYATRGDDGSAVTLATVELSMEAAINELVNAHIVLLHEDGGGTPLDVDNATMTIGNLEKFPVYLTVGRMAVPFGNFNSHMVSDPLTLAMGETLESAMQVGFEAHGFNGSVYLFNGDANRTGKDDLLDQFGANLGYSMEKNGLNLEAGISYINSIDDSDGVWGTVMANSATVVDNISGLGVHGTVGYRGFSLIGEYVGATESFSPAELAWKNEGAQPMSWNTELGYTLDLMGKESTVAIGVQGTDEAQALGLPENRYLIAASVGIFDKTQLSFEWFYDKDYAANGGGSDNHANAATAQLAVEF